MRGTSLTPFLLDYMVRGTDGAALAANLSAVRGDCAVAAAIARAWSEWAPLAGPGASTPQYA